MVTKKTGYFFDNISNYVLYTRERVKVNKLYYVAQLHKIHFPGDLTSSNKISDKNLTSYTRTYVS